MRFRINRAKSNSVRTAQDSWRRRRRSLTQSRCLLPKIGSWYCSTTDCQQDPYEKKRRQEAQRESCVRNPHKKDNEWQTSLTARSKMWSQSQWEWFHSVRCHTIPYKEATRMRRRRRRRKEKRKKEEEEQEEEDGKKEVLFTYSEFKDVSFPISVGMGPLSLIWLNSLQQTEAHRVRLPAETTPKKKTKRQNSLTDVSIPISVEIVPASPSWYKNLNPERQMRGCVKIGG